MVTQQSGNQFDDDLTVGLDNDGSFSTDSIDLFEFTGDEESPIARLKTIILSIDWEINDEILQQLEDELVDLADIWSGDKVKLIYIQGLSKIGKYIYKERANAHPNSIKLLITFYHNLEKIVSSDDLMSEDEKKQLLIEDVKKFDQLKSQIGTVAPREDDEIVPAPGIPVDDIQELKALKAQVLGIDWEINDVELQKLSDEVLRLEDVFSHSKAKLILLQGIGALSAYINKMRSRSNSTAFTLLHSFYGVLETISSSTLVTEDEKRLLLAEVDKFKSFKAEIAKSPAELTDGSRADSVPPESVTATEVIAAESDALDVLPADDSDEQVQVASDVDTRLSTVFGDVEDVFDNEIADKSVALEGVNVETEADDDSDEEALPHEDGAIAPALAEVEEESSFSVEKLAEDLAKSQKDEKSEKNEAVISGVDVETEADDESDEEKLPYEDGEVAPALSGSFDDASFNGGSLDAGIEESDSEDLDNRLDSFFDDEVETATNEWSGEQLNKVGALDTEVAEDAENIFSAIDDNEITAGDDLVAALSDVEEDDSSAETEFVAALSDVEEDDSSAETEFVAALSDVEEDVSSAEAEFVAALSDVEEDDLSAETEFVAALSDVDEDDSSAETEFVAALSDVEEDDSSAETEFVAALSDVEEDDSSAEAEFVAALSDVEEDDSSAETEFVAALSDVDEDDPSIEDDFAEAFIDKNGDELEQSEIEIPESLTTDEADVDQDAPEIILTEDDEQPVAKAVLEKSIEESLSFFDDEVSAPVFKETEGDIVPESPLEEDSRQDHLSFLDEEVPAPASTETFEQFSTDDIDGALSFTGTDDDVVAALSDEQVEPDSEEFVESLTGADTFFEETVAQEVPVADTALSFFNEESAPTTEQEEDDNDQIQFTLPGEIATDEALDSDGIRDSSIDDVIEFNVPGEDDSTEVLFVADEAFETTTQSDEVIFEAVADDVEVDSLPGEVFTDSADLVQPDEEVEFLEARETGYSSDDLLTLTQLIPSFRENIDAEAIQSIFSEINRLRSDPNATSTIKIFLQLLSTVCQNISTVPKEAETANLLLMRKILSGLHSCVSSEVLEAEVQKQLLGCTSQVLLGQYDNADNGEGEASSDSEEAPSELESVGDGLDVEEQLQQAQPLKSDEQMKSFVHEELAEIRKLFLDEITTLRKEITDK